MLTRNYATIVRTVKSARYDGIWTIHAQIDALGYLYTWRASRNRTYPAQVIVGNEKGSLRFGDWIRAQRWIPVTPKPGTDYPRSLAELFRGV